MQKPSTSELQRKGETKSGGGDDTSGIHWYPVSPQNKSQQLNIQLPNFRNPYLNKKAMEFLQVQKRRSKKLLNMTDGLFFGTCVPPDKHRAVPGVCVCVFACFCVCGGVGGDMLNAGSSRL